MIGLKQAERCEIDLKKGGLGMMLVMGCYAGYTATLLKNLLAGVLSYSSFKYLKVTVLQKTKQSYLESVQSVLYGTLARAISAS